MSRKSNEKNRRSNQLQPLLSTERSQKYDLLLHLLSNIPEGLVLCGPVGIGKSTILDLVQSASLEGRIVCRINASSTTQFEEIQDTLVERIGASLKNSSRENLSENLGCLKRNEQIVVLLIDDAGEMPPGVLTAVCRFANSNPVLRPVFTMTADRLHLMSSSDPAIANCQVIEIPPLTELQCGEFLQNLSRKPDVSLSFSAITPSLIEHTYQESRGVPGKILSSLSGLSKGQMLNAGGASLALYGSVSLIVAVCIGYLLWDQSADLPLNRGSGLSNTGTAVDKPVSDADGGLSVGVKPIPFGRLEGTTIGRDGMVPGVSDQIDPLNFRRTDPTNGLEQENFAGLTVATGSELLESGFVQKDLDPDLGAGRNKPHDSEVSSSNPTEVELAIAIENQSTGLKESSSNSQLPGGDTFTEEPDGSDKRSIQEPDIKNGNNTKKVDRPSKPQQGSTDIETTDSESRKEEAPNKSKLVKANGVIPGVWDDQWIKKQNPQQFTLQLLAVKRLDAMKKFIKSNSQLKDLAVYRTHKKGTNWYALIHGVYPSLREAKDAAKILPSKLRNAWPRKFKSVQSGIIDFGTE